MQQAGQLFFNIVFAFDGGFVVAERQPDALRLTVGGTAKVNPHDAGTQEEFFRFVE